jgi:hypothetical protein
MTIGPQQWRPFAVMPLTDKNEKCEGGEPTRSISLWILGSIPVFLRSVPEFSEISCGAVTVISQSDPPAG